MRFAVDSTSRVDRLHAVVAHLEEVLLHQQAVGAIESVLEQEAQERARAARARAAPPAPADPAGARRPRIERGEHLGGPRNSSPCSGRSAPRPGCAAPPRRPDGSGSCSADSPALFHGRNDTRAAGRGNGPRKGEPPMDTDSRRSAISDQRSATSDKRRATSDASDPCLDKGARPRLRWERARFHARPGEGDRDARRAIAAPRRVAVVTSSCSPPSWPAPWRSPRHPSRRARRLLDAASEPPGPGDHSTPTPDITASVRSLARRGARPALPRPLGRRRASRLLPVRRPSHRASSSARS